MFRRILRYISLNGQVENFDEIHNTIVSGIDFKGTNLWVLVCAVVIASIGLNINSTAVIIGAMLISPLMGPINGMGYGIATYDFSLFKRSLKNFSFAVAASLIASTLYFVLSPVSTAKSELLDRTTPTIYDVLVALFGGFAGIIAISSRLKGNVIPGVAIATTLMPPLCTVGYGIATAQFVFIYGALYLFTINTVCIGMASIMVSKFLKFPIRKDIPVEKKKRINNIIYIILIITILPSFYLGYQLVQNEKFSMQAQRYTKSVNIYKGNYLLNEEINPTTKTIKLIYGGASLNDQDKKNIRDRAQDFSLGNAHINIMQGLSFSDIQAKGQSKESSFKEQISRLNQVIYDNKNKQDSILTRLQIGKRLLEEIRPLYPQIESCSYSEAFNYIQDSTIILEKENIVTFSSSQIIYKPDQDKIREWIEKRLNAQNVKIYFDYSFNQ